MLSRRSFLLATLAACSRREGVSPESAPSIPPSQPDAGTTDVGRGSTQILEWTLDGVSTRAAIVVPTWGTGTRFPVLVALHGRGESLKPPSAGALGWPRDYALVRAISRACAPPLTDVDFEGMSDPARLADTNRDLAARPFRGLIVVCPWVPELDLLKESEVQRFGRFVLDVLLPRVRKETPALSAPESTGIDGVSLGGALALRVGLSQPAEFGAVGALQPAIGEERTQELTDLARAARSKRPGLKLRLTTSHEDYFRPAVKKLTESWSANGVAHDFADVPGPHDYPFNRGPGAYEMLLWQDRMLAG